MEILKNLPETESADVEMFLARHADLIQREAKRYARSDEEAEDIAQDTRLKILCAGDMASVHNAPAWVRAIVRNAAMDHLSKTRLHPPIETACWIVASSPGAEPEHAAIARCALIELFQRVRNMRQTEREIIAGIAIGQSEIEIAERLGKTKNAVYLCLHRLRKGLAAERNLEN
jgi:RNA polymerase sigma factor (sigma-70 family)